MTLVTLPHLFRTPHSPLSRAVHPTHFHKFRQFILLSAAPRQYYTRRHPRESHHSPRFYSSSSLHQQNDPNLTSYNDHSTNFFHLYRTELILYCLAGVSLLASYLYWLNKTKKNSLQLQKETQAHFQEIFEAALSSGMQVLAHPTHLAEIKGVLLGDEHSKERLALRCCMIPASNSGKIDSMEQITEKVMKDAMRNSCLMHLNVDYYLLPAVAQIEQDWDHSTEEKHMLKEVSRKRHFMNRIVNVDCYIPVSAVPESEMHNTHDTTKIMALHVKMTHMGEKMTPFIEDYRVTEVNLMDVSRLPWRNQWTHGSYIEWMWYKGSQASVNIEKSVTPDGKFQFVGGIPWFHRHFSYHCEASTS